MMMLQPRIEILQEKKLIGKHLTMSFADNKTGELWRSFMPYRKEITNAVGSELYSLQFSIHFILIHSLKNGQPLR